MGSALNAAGVNVVLAGSLSALEEHMQTIREHSLLQGTDIDFKLAPDLPAGVDARATEETGFDHLTVRQCKVQRSGPLHGCHADQAI